MKVTWCSICNAHPADGILTVYIDDMLAEIPACKGCVNDPRKVEFVD